jgi:hypothetical protein
MSHQGNQIAPLVFCINHKLEVQLQLRWLLSELWVQLPKKEVYIEIVTTNIVHD